MTPKEPLCTILLTTYNRADDLAIAIKSVLRQTCQDWELLVLDDHSTDHTNKVMRSFTDPRIQHIRTAHNVGFSANFRNGIARAKGTYVFLLSDDDLIVQSDALSTLLKEMQRYDAGVGAMSLLFFGTDMHHPSYYVPVSKKILHLPPSEANILRTREWHFGFMSGCTYRRDLIQMKDIGDDLWLSHVKPLWRILNSHGCVYLGTHFILGKISTNGNIANLNIEKNKGYHLFKQLNAYRELDSSPSRYKAFRDFHVDGVRSSLFGVKYFSSNLNTIRIVCELCRIDPRRWHDIGLWIRLIAALLAPKLLLSYVRNVRLQKSANDLQPFVKSLHLEAHINEIRSFHQQQWQK